MDDLISRKAAVEYLMTNMGWYDVDGYEIEDADKIRTCIEDLINGIPSVPAVPLEPLCEWLDKNNDFVPFCADDKADCNSCELEGAECIKKRIMLWMEGLDDHQ